MKNWEEVPQKQIVDVAIQTKDFKFLINMATKWF